MKQLILLFLLFCFSQTAFSQVVSLLNGGNSPQKIAIYRWNFKNDWVDAREDEESNLLNWGYSNKTFVCYLFKEPMRGTVAINRWNLPSTGDWVSVTESASADMEKWGYQSKILLGYAYPNPHENTVPINRWYLTSAGDWVTVPENASGDMQKWGYVNKTLTAYTPK